ncbi:MAG: hypothetical protein C4534_08290 [Gaiellales bacterium]|nr:MAG: hypothetical protein C4534_08290 [Gaiellales bacterium]
MFLFIKRLFDVLVHTIGITTTVLPTAADGAAALAVQLTSAAVAWTFGAWTQIALGAVVTANTQIIGVSLENFVGALGEGEVQIGTGTAPAGTAIITVPITANYFPLPGGPLVVPGTGIVARYRTSTGAADNVSVKLVTKLGN